MPKFENLGHVTVYTIYISSSGLLQHEATFYCSCSCDFKMKTVQGKK